MSGEQSDFRYDSYCGLYCGACSVLMAAQEGNVQKVADEWHVPVQDAECHGCKSGVTARPCRRCKLKACAQGRGIEFCFECPEHPCTRLSAFKLDGYPHHLVAVCNLEVIKRIGLVKWLAEQEAVWRCPSCGQRFEHYQGNCPQCRQALRDSRVQAVELVAQKGVSVQLKDI